MELFCQQHWQLKVSHTDLTVLWGMLGDRSGWGISWKKRTFRKCS